MKAPDEIKKGLDFCGDITDLEHSCTGCPYHLENAVCDCEDGLERDALAYIQQLESRLAQAERERDAAVADLKLVRCCGTCVNNEGGCTTECYIVSGIPTGWQWRGVCEEKTKEGTNESDDIAAHGRQDGSGDR